MKTDKRPTCLERRSDAKAEERRPEACVCLCVRGSLVLFVESYVGEEVDTGVGPRDGHGDPLTSFIHTEYEGDCRQGDPFA